ncbi:beta-propeller fold lactonase family protein [Pseudoalteromonas sp. SR44-8]|uniref:beta-propeller fold lactonase family protein n=1 Tax=Pseudoalteromonas sp. SR44-8 TaxID=2760933 RepID=UPI0016000BCE|nr:beta-propeller fold lactonase family protein [Pseudoalteromonas sp. SR44-8]MBB1301499.1 beta-propeller fold lactonase family protein [Pseudoalteromonas sp. SR44-8]
MCNNKKLISLLIFIMLVNFNVANVTASGIESLQLIQILKDDVNDVDGLGNPRSVKVLSDNSKVFVSSGDDNAFAVFNLDKDFKLTFSQVFENSSTNINGLEGASGVTYFDRGNQVVVTGFYDGALSRFSQNNSSYRFSQFISDGLSYDRVFDSDVPVGELDNLGLLGAWDIVKTSNEKQLFVASYMSNAISILDIMVDKKVTFNRVIKDARPLDNNLGKPIAVALSPLNNELYVLGFDGHQLTIFDRDDKGDLLVKQVLKNGVAGVEKFINPQKIVVSPNGEFLYVACAGSDSLVVFHKLDTGQYTFLQAIDHLDVGGSGLEGASSLAISSDGSKVYAAGESGVGLYLFSAGVDGRLSYKNKLLSVHDNELKRISSLTLTEDNQHLLVATGKGNSLFIFKIKTI